MSNGFEDLSNSFKDIRTNVNRLVNLLRVIALAIAIFGFVIALVCGQFYLG